MYVDQVVVIDDLSENNTANVRMRGIKIRDYSVVPAGAVVTKDIPNYTLVAGVPARVIKELDPDKIQKL